MRRASMDGERIVVDFISNHNNVIAWVKTSRVWRQFIWEGVDAADAWNSLTAYHIAAQFGLLQTILRLLDFSASDVDVKDSRGRIPPSYAAEVGHDDVISLLISKGEVDINAGDYFGFSPLFCAAWKGHTSMVELLLSKSANKNWSPYSPEGLGTRECPPPFWDRAPMVLALERCRASTVALLFGAITVSSFEREFGQRPSRRQAQDLWDTMLKGCPKVWSAKEHSPGHLDDAAAACHDFLARYFSMDTKKYFDPSIVSPPPRNIMGSKRPNRVAPRCGRQRGHLISIGNFSI
ncbi:hypothetical protein TWF106_000168 [Orbilia oligospora]|uniref:Uncharacterized protein n=1 Tax=Orbilia oligospora TaxID=2813651 RepID=A0A6G1ML03_ORBOL|nr:hypothetical protein TWF679_006989 [Orbilia oligospora]KAF3229679.1 hypothetical protein TWF106_000067 [Orbilia oligospora]KAF3229780.1 hypothetical protein TWF106_000168 [Orbilia oligospora]KAF3230081.1 hypothetical protein TWF191_000321 [Orbilia oligospora]KAF3262470.1 hypothetical protein TWF192_007145 [Orbilia oligospora]